MGSVKSATLQDVMLEVSKYIRKKDSIELIQKAADFAIQHHEGQFRKSGEPYSIHLINVAFILATLRVGPKTLAAGFMHDVIEDTDINKEKLTELFDGEIADLVDAVTKIGAIRFKGKDDPEYQAANHRKLFIAMAKDIRVILIKLADRLHNMRTLEYQPEANQKRISQETLDVYAPIAHRLGISAIKNELEDLCFYYLNNEEYHHIAHLVEEKKVERDAAVQKMIRDFEQLLTMNKLKFRIFGRSKHLYSIYKKMTKKHKRFDEILDLLAIRIITKTELNCYEILGYIHAQYRPIPGRLKDYIAVPKTNMYQSLHTTIIGNNGKIFEVQIRTEEMDEIADRGIAAHWRYKEGKKYDARVEQKEIEEKLYWFRDFANYTGEHQNESASEYMDTLKRDIFEANVYVMTPKGRIIDLPNGATPIDFAYRIHTDVGHTTVGAIVNDAIVPLNTELHTGDVVNIKTQKGTKPSEDWLKFVKSNQARNKIRSYFIRKEDERKAHEVPSGEKILADELKKRGFDAEKYMETKRFEAILAEFRCKDISELFYNISVKSVNLIKVIEKLTNEKRSLGEEKLTQILKRDGNKRQISNKIGVVIPGVELMKLSLAQCCMPVYGDEIIGFITKGEGVKVHHKDCINIKKQSSRLIDVQWDERADNHMYDSDLIIHARNRNYLLTDVVTAISQTQSTIIKISSNLNQETFNVTIKLTVQVHSIEQVRVVIANIKKVESVIDVKRTSH